ncbi:MAG: glycosyltransferase family 9 protein [Bacteroidetes bacterium]|nr:glycosyltransferase family 9 protein [Bacteroidota bacterium]
MKILIIQTAFLGDVILATALVEKLKQQHPSCSIDFLLAKGNESLLENHPLLRKIIVFDKKNKKYSNLIHILQEVRREKYSHVVNVHRFLSSGLITAFSKAKYKIGFQKNPLSSLFSKAVDHQINQDSRLHEVDRNQTLIEELTDSVAAKPKLYPSISDYETTTHSAPYICIAPASIWFTKQLPIDKWIALIDYFEPQMRIFLLGSKNDQELCFNIQKQTKHNNVEVVAGKFSLLQSVALMEKAKMNYVNDSAPQHLASAINAPLTVFFLSTIPAFGFGPLSDQSMIIETKHTLSCRPCGLHGKKECPEKHFKCSEIELNL